MVAAGNVLIFNKIKEALGLLHCKIIGVGTASVSCEVLKYFMDFNIPIMECYGMTESTGPHTTNIRDKKHTQWKVGSCGIHISGVETKINHPDKDSCGEVSDVVTFVMM